MIIADEDRPKHIYVPGKTRHGKSTLLFWMAIQDIALGKGVCVMDAKGDLVNKLVDYIPSYRVNDTLYLDTNTPVPLDFMGYQEGEKEAVIGELKFLLMKTVEPQHAPLMTANITDLIYTLFDYNENPATPPHCRATFLDLYYFLTDKTRQHHICSLLRDEDLAARWKSNFPNPVEASRITTRMTPFVRSKTLRQIFGAKNPRLNIAEAVDDQKILLVNLAPMEDIQVTYALLFLSKIRQAIYRRTNPAAERTPYYLYCDEFQEFQTSDFHKMLSMAGGLGLCLTLSNQYVGILQPQILQSIKGNVSTFICFRLGDESINALRGEFPQHTPSAYDKYRDKLTTKLEALQVEHELAAKRFPSATGYSTDDDIYSIHRDLLNLPKPYDQPDVSILPFLGVGQALYRAANGTAELIHTPPPPAPSPESNAESIRNRTIRDYACETPEVCFTLEDGDRDLETQNSVTSGEIAAGGRANVSSHGNKKTKS
jgi:hypothetical protein